MSYYTTASGQQVIVLKEDTERQRGRDARKSNMMAAQIIADLSTWDVHAPNPLDVLDAIQIQKRFQLSFWDAMIVASAMNLGCQTLWTEDLDTGQVLDEVTIVNPFL